MKKILRAGAVSIDTAPLFMAFMAFIARFVRAERWDSALKKGAFLERRYSPSQLLFFARRAPWRAHSFIWRHGEREIIRNAGIWKTPEGAITIKRVRDGVITPRVWSRELLRLSPTSRCLVVRQPHDG